MNFDVDEVANTDFVHKELILFSIAGNTRSTPPAVDGLFMTSQREVQFSCFKRKDLQESRIKVVQLAGCVSGHSAYHHGEMGPNGTIVSRTPAAATTPTCSCPAVSSARASRAARTRPAPVTSPRRSRPSRAPSFPRPTTPCSTTRSRPIVQMRRPVPEPAHPSD